MKLSSIRNLAGLKEVLRSPSASGPDPVYWVFSEIGSERFANITVIAPGVFNGEFAKTYGHYHGSKVDETYKLIEGEGVLVLQKKHYEKEVFVPDVVDEVLLVKAEPGDELLIKPEYGHSWSNVGKTALVSLDDWRAGHSPSDYEYIKDMKGLAYYLTIVEGKVEPVLNPNYKSAPFPVWLTAKEYKQKFNK